MEEQIKEMMEQMGIMLDASYDIIPKFAKIYKVMYDSLVKEGFTEGQAMQIVANYKFDVKS